MKTNLSLLFLTALFIIPTSSLWGSEKKGDKSAWTHGAPASLGASKVQTAASTSKTTTTPSVTTTTPPTTATVAAASCSSFVAKTQSGTPAATTIAGGPEVMKIPTDSKTELRSQKEKIRLSRANVPWLRRIISSGYYAADLLTDLKAIQPDQEIDPGYNTKNAGYINSAIQDLIDRKDKDLAQQIVPLLRKYEIPVEASARRSLRALLKDSVKDQHQAIELNYDDRISKLQKLYDAEMAEIKKEYQDRVRSLQTTESMVAATYKMDKSGYASDNDEDCHDFQPADKLQGTSSSNLRGVAKGQLSKLIPHPESKRARGANSPSSASGSPSDKTA